MLEHTGSVDHAEVLIATRHQESRIEWVNALRDESHWIASCADEESFRSILTRSNNLRVVAVESPFFSSPDAETVQKLAQLLACGPAVLLILPESDRQAFRAVLDVGIDMPLLAPLSSEEIRSAITALLRRQIESETASEPNGQSLADFWICDPVSWRIQPPGGNPPVKLTYREIEFILRIAEHPGVPVPREEFSSLFGISAHLLDLRRLEVMVRRLRKNILTKTGQDFPIQTAHGIGYALGTHIKVTSIPAEGNSE